MTLPHSVGVGFKAAHAPDLMQDPGCVSWLEIHAENYLLDGGPRMALLAQMAERFPISVHGVGMSIGGTEKLDPDHLERVARLVKALNPASFSEHLAWSTHEGVYFNDLLPLPYTQATMDLVCAHVSQVQDRLQRRMLLENPSSYLAFSESTWSEPDFLGEISRRTGCGLLLDVANVFISANNLDSSAGAYLDAFALSEIGEIHLAGPDADEAETGLLIDSHSRTVPDAIWGLYVDVLARTGPLPTLIEWDNDVPEFAVLEHEAARASAILLKRAAA
ncbi:MNIO family bufferin maturase [Paracoccus aerodenitrificans]|uniref:MNIO family bufferin maturase n=1 Tax=Paracoccus aerodenitrificans TaxID=3017781 RepID=UPI0022F0D47C|nr:DUF692 domain-containing protein [Paracoccus aerodenitrificans]WBU64938.1 DUF692 domain-containing protein [Paracoccus aerodenitrificans]